jgi:beta-glucosidase
MWSPDAAGAATANVLLGRADPAGRLPVTWPASAAQGVADEQGIHPERTTGGLGPAGQRCPDPSGPAAGEPGCTTTYSEGLFVGYRWYDEQKLSPQYPFGYGLSYTTFSYSGLRWSPLPGGGLAVTFLVTNTGPVAGDEVPQVYLGAPVSPPPGVAFAARALAAFTRISLRPGESRMVTLRVPARQLQYWDPARGWQTADGPRPLDVGSDERSDLAATVNVTG